MSGIRIESACNGGIRVAAGEAERVLAQPAAGAGVVLAGTVFLQAGVSVPLLALEVEQLVDD
jgi:hypothetical protein